MFNDDEIQGIGHESETHAAIGWCDEGDLDSHIDDMAEALAGQRDERW